MRSPPQPQPKGPPDGFSKGPHRVEDSKVHATQRGIAHPDSAANARPHGTMYPTKMPVMTGKPMVNVSRNR
jgi:hypothetical protein